MNSNAFQLLFVFLAGLSAFTLAPAKSSVREMVQGVFVPVALPVHVVALWMVNRISPQREPDMLSPSSPRNVEEIRRQNSELLTRVANLEAQLDDLKQLSAQYALLGTDLRKMVQPATVIGGPVGQRQTLTIATTNLTSIREKMAVVHPLGFVGQIYAVAIGGQTARVLLVTDPSSRLSARFARFVTRPGGGVASQMLETQPPLVEGDGHGLVVRMLPAREVRTHLRVGDIAVLDDTTFPPALKGLRLGTIKKITLPPTDAGHAQIELEPTATFTTLREVLVVDK